MKKHKLISLFLIAFTLFGFKQTDTYSKISEDIVSLEYPSSWDKMDVPGYAVIVKEKAIGDKYSVLTNFAVEFDKNYNDLKEYTVFWKNKMVNDKYLSNWELLSEEKIKYKGFTAIEFICKYEMGSFKAKTKVIIIVADNKIINLNTTSSLGSFNDKTEITDRIYDSVRIRK